eukprot:6185089-Pleurochrysis_carterae.AAC.1
MHSVRGCYASLQPAHCRPSFRRSYAGAFYLLCRQQAVVFGASTGFCDDSADASLRVALPPGSALILDGESANTAMHSLPAAPEPRISLTFRRIGKAAAARGCAAYVGPDGSKPAGAPNDQHGHAHATERPAHDVSSPGLRAANRGSHLPPPSSGAWGDGDTGHAQPTVEEMEDIVEVSAFASSVRP